MTVSEEVSKKKQNGGYQEIQTGIFLFSKWLGLFPINVESGKLSISLPNVLVSICLRSVLCSYVVVAETIRTSDFGDNISYRIFTFYGALLSGMLIKPVTLFHQVYNLETFSRAMRTLSEVDAMIGVPLKNLAWKLNVAIFVTCNLVSTTYELCFFFEIIKNSPSVLLYSQVIADIFLVTSQFLEFVRLASLRLEFLCKTINDLTLERWCQCQEMLCSFNKDITKCYTTQLSLTLLSFLLYFVSRIYIIIKTENNLIKIDISAWIFIIFFFFWKICHICRESVLMVNK